MLVTRESLNTIDVRLSKMIGTCPHGAVRDHLLVALNSVRAASRAKRTELPPRLKEIADTLIAYGGSPSKTARVLGLKPSYVSKCKADIARRARFNAAFL
jgi:hypothetical protein